MNSNEKPKNPFLSVGGIIGAVIGYYCGIMLLIPAAISFVAVLILKNVDLPRFNPFKIAAAVVIGHTGWMVVGFVLAKNIPAMSIVPDIILMVIGLVWLFANPGRGPVWYFTILEAATAVVNLLNLLPQHFGATAHKALVAHLSLRAFVIAALWLGLRQQPASTPPPLPNLPGAPEQI
ncbi:MAG TPA: hypothetical protein VI282_16205 [Verrucomicrobiae bacterium]|jgi:hypothetical protein